MGIVLRSGARAAGATLCGGLGPGPAGAGGVGRSSERRAHALPTTGLRPTRRYSGGASEHLGDAFATHPNAALLNE